MKERGRVLKRGVVQQEKRYNNRKTERSRRQNNLQSFNI